jgi:hypothetical protein
MRVFLAVASVMALGVLVLGAAGQADLWGPTLWTDTFQDGDYTSNPAWATFSSPGASRQVVTWEGDYAFRLTAPYVLAYGAGWSGAYVDNVQGDQGILGWVDSSPLASDDWATLCLLRYTPPSVAFGTGYACAVLHTATGGVYAQLFQIDETSYSTITDPALVSSTYTDVWVRFVALGTGLSTALAARVWPAGQAEPSTWTVDSNNTGGGSGITNHYNTGRGGVGVVATANGVTADAYFDDIEYCGGALCVEPPWQGPTAAP